MAEVVQKVIEYYEELCDQFRAPESWCDNIQKSIRLLPTEITLSNFYSYLFNPDSYQYREHIVCVSEEDARQFEIEAKKFDEQVGMRVTTYKNLNDGKILYEPLSKLTIEDAQEEKRMD
jgi:hypothetical protein